MLLVLMSLSLFVSGGASWPNEFGIPINAVALADDKAVRNCRLFFICIVTHLSGPSCLQLAFKLIQKAPVRSFGNDLAGCGLDHASFAQPQRVETQSILGIVLAPFVVWDLVERLQCVVIARCEPC